MLSWAEFCWDYHSLGRKESSSRPTPLLEQSRARPGSCWFRVIGQPGSRLAGPCCEDLGAQEAISSPGEGDCVFWEPCFKDDNDLKNGVSCYTVWLRSSVATMEYNRAAFQKIKARIAIWSGNPTSGSLSKKKIKSGSRRVLARSCSQRHFPHLQRCQTPNMPMDRWSDQIMSWTYHGKLFGFNQVVTMRTSVDEPWGHKVKRIQSVTKR